MLQNLNQETKQNRTNKSAVTEKENKNHKTKQNGTNKSTVERKGEQEGKRPIPRLNQPSSQGPVVAVAHVAPPRSNASSRGHPRSSPCGCCPWRFLRRAPPCHPRQRFLRRTPPRLSIRDLALGHVRRRQRGLR